MTKGEIVDEIVIDANMGLQWPLRCPWTFFWVMMMWWWSYLSALEDDLDSLDKIVESLEMGI